MAYALATGLSLCAVVLLSGLPEPKSLSGPRRHLGHELREGASFVLGHPLLRPILVTAVFFNTSWFLLQAIYVAYAVQDLKLGAAGVGATLAMYGFGMVVGALLAPRLADRVSFGTTIAVGPLSGLVAGVADAGNGQVSLRTPGGRELLPVRRRGLFCGPSRRPPFVRR